MQNSSMHVMANSEDHSPKLNKTSISPDVYAITHDLRAPLMSIKGLINLLKSDLTKEEFTEYINFLEQSVNKMDDSISRIVEHSKDSKEDIKESVIKPQEIDFHKIIEESLRSLRYMQEIDSVHTTISVQTTVGFHSDPEMLSSIFNNMISNAVRYRDRDKNSFLHMDVSCGHESAIIIFTDNGIGIDEVFQRQIFNKLFRVQQDQRGSGLGLYIVKTSVEKLNGTIEINSALGRGTTFTIEIPTLQ